MTKHRILGVALIASLTACAASPAPQAAAPVATATAAPPPSAVPDDFEWHPVGEKVARIPRVVVLDAGTGERMPIGWSAHGPFRLLMSIRHDTLAVGDDNYEDTVDVTLTVDVEADQTAPGVTSVFAMVREAKTAPGQTPGAETSKYTDLVGHGVLWMVTPQGHVIGHGTIVKSKRADLEGKLNELGRTLAPALFTPLPREPVGEGARWRVRSPVFSFGVMQLEEAEYKLDVRKPLKDRPGHVVGISATGSRAALQDDRGLITSDDGERAWAALNAVSQRSFDDIARTTKPVPRGERTVVFPDIDALFGEYTWSLRTDVEGVMETATEKDEIRGELRDRIHVRRLKTETAAK
jgi:hypothetical protein